ncbi:MAG: IS21 family transposase [Candidatus Berkiella sp.]
MDEYILIINQLRKGGTLRGLARDKLADRKTIRKVRDIALRQGWLEPGNPMPTEEELSLYFKKSSSNSLLSLQPFRAKIEEWTQQGVQASTIYAHLQQEHGFKSSYSVVQRYIKSFKDTLRPVTTILDFKPGESAQVDFGQGPRLIDERTGEEKKTWIFVMVLSWSRHMYAEIVLRQDVMTWLACHRRAFEWFNGVPGKIIIDNAKCAITKACYYNPCVQRAYRDCASGYGFIVSPCPPYDPQKKGRVESGVKYVKNRFVPLRQFRNLSDANQQLKLWLMQEAGERKHGTTHEKPLVLFEIEQPALKRLPNHPPEFAVWEKVKLHGDCHVQFQKCRYSGPYRLARQELWLRATDTTVRLYFNHQLVALHPRLEIAGTRHTIPEHLPPNALAYSMRDAQWCLKQAKEIGAQCLTVIEGLLNDSVVDYLRAAQNILGLRKKYGDMRLEAACQRALVFQSVHYKTIKTMLETGAEQQALPREETTALAEPYSRGGRFCRDASLLLH